MTEKNAVTLKGKLTAFFETGTEGVIWSFEEDGKSGYDALHCLKKGDFLRVFNDAAKNDVVFEGHVDLEYKRRLRPYPSNPENGQQEVLGRWVHGFQKSEDPEVWAKMFFAEKPAELILHNPSMKPKAP